MIFDTDVLIFAHRGSTKAADIIIKTDEKKISIITLMELLQGARDKKHLKVILRFIKEFNFEVLNLDSNIGSRALFLVETYNLSHNMVMADSIIAATAIENSEYLITANAKHYNFIPELNLTKFNP